MSCIVDTGIIAMSSPFWTPLEPFGFSVPTTVNRLPLIFTIAPSGSVPLNSSSTTVAPRTMTLAWSSTSWSERNVPEATW